MSRTAALAIRVPIAIVAAVCLLPPAGRVHAQQNLDARIRENRARLDSIRRERETLENELDRLRGRARDLTSEIRNIERQRDVTERVVNELDRQMASMTSQLDTVTMDLMLAQDALAETNAVLERRLTEIYKRGPLYAFQVLLAAESFGDLLSRYKYLYLVSRQDRALAQEVEELADRIEVQRRQHVSVRNELSQQLDVRGTELRRYRNLERQRQNTLVQTRQSTAATASRLDSLERTEAQVAEIINSLEEARTRAIARGDRTVGTISTDDLGGLDWPVDGGNVVYEFGRYSGPDGTRLRRLGIGIGVPEGTPVRAVATGTVESATALLTWGPTVILNHGGGYYTLYLYLSAFEVQRGQLVSGGQVIGRSGGARSDEGPHIEFQIREGQLTLDPRHWLRPRR
jgi:septal ring factor EnvC (AmiA/AmiB activator)